MTKLPKLRIKENGNYFIKFRVNKVLYPYFRKEFITKSFMNTSLKNINVERSRIYNSYIEIMQLANNPKIDKEYLLNLINSFNIEILSIKNSNSLINEKLTISMVYEKFKVYYDSLDIKTSTKKQTYVTMDLFIQLIGGNKLIEDIEPFDLIEIKNKIEKLGNRNYKEFKHLSLKEYIKIKNIPLEKRINDGSLKNHIKHIKKFFVFCTQNRFTKFNPAENLNIKVDTDKKDSFTQDEINKLIDVIYDFENDLKYLYLMIIYSGMRRSEVYNCSIKEENGIKYFDIIDSKTISGIRKIPLHSKIEFLTNEMLENAKTITNPVNFGAIFNKKVKSVVTDSKRKTLHSIRHYVATKLKRNVTSDSIIKAILGHSETDTLNTVYARDGYSVGQLKEFIELL